MKNANASQLGRWKSQSIYSSFFPSSLFLSFTKIYTYSWSVCRNSTTIRNFWHIRWDIFRASYRLNLPPRWGSLQREENNKNGGTDGCTTLWGMRGELGHSSSYFIRSGSLTHTHTHTAKILARDFQIWFTRLATTVHLRVMRVYVPSPLPLFFLFPHAFLLIRKFSELSKWCARACKAWNILYTPVYIRRRCFIYQRYIISSPCAHTRRCVDIICYIDYKR